MGAIRWFEEIGIEDIPLVGGKNASLAEMYRELAPKGIRRLSDFKSNEYAPCSVLVYRR